MASSRTHSQANNQLVNIPKTHWDVFEGLDLAQSLLWLSELANYVFGRISHSRAISCPA